MDKLDKIRQDKAQLIGNITVLIETFLGENPDVEIDNMRVEFMKLFTEDRNAVASHVYRITVDIKI